MKGEPTGPWYTHVQGWAFTLGYTGLAAALFYASGWYRLPDWCTDQAAIAAWVQAVGSVAAIVAAFLVVKRDHELQERRRVQGDVDKLRVIASAVFFCRAHAAAAQRDFGTQLFPTLNRSGLDAQRHALASVPLLEIPDWRAALIVRECLAALAQLDDGLPTLGPLSSDRTPSRVAEWVHATLMHLNAAVGTLTTLEENIRDVLVDHQSDMPLLRFTSNDFVVRPIGQGSEM